MMDRREASPSHDRGAILYRPMMTWNATLLQECAARGIHSWQAVKKILKPGRA